LGGENDIPGAINCPRCGALLIPKLGYKEMSIDEALTGPDDEAPTTSSSGTGIADFANLPPQIRPVVDNITGAAYVTYISPATMRSCLESYIEEHGEFFLERATLKALDPELYYNLWWFCARFSLPLPLPVSIAEGNDSRHYCTIATWYVL
jgi:hypothetical protein